MVNIKNVKEILKENGYKMTFQRKVIVDIFLEHREEHLSAEDVYTIVRVNNPDMGLATIYRTLDLFAELGIFTKLNFGDGKYRYEYKTEEDHHHHHLICLSCGSVVEFSEDLLEQLEDTILNDDGFKVIDHQLKLYGYCKKCQTKQ